MGEAALLLSAPGRGRDGVAPMNKHNFVPALVAVSLLMARIASADTPANPTVSTDTSANPMPCASGQVHPGNCDGLRGQIADDSATFTAGPGENTEFNTPLDGLAGPSH